MEGFQTSVITDTKREKFYQQFNFIDEVLAFKDIDEAVDLINSEEDSVLIPHGSLVEYLGQERVNKIKIKIYGNRNIFGWEGNQHKKMYLLKTSNIKIPQTFEKPEDVDRVVIVKLPGAKGGRGYFLAKNKQEVRQGIDDLIKKKEINSEEDVIIQEYIVGVPMYFQFFYSKLLQRTEIFGIDI